MNIFHLRHETKVKDFITRNSIFWNRVDWRMEDHTEQRLDSLLHLFQTQTNTNTNTQAEIIMWSITFFSSLLFWLTFYCSHTHMPSSQLFISVAVVVLSGSFPSASEEKAYMTCVWSPAPNVCFGWFLDIVLAHLMSTQTASAIICFWTLCFHWLSQNTGPTGS